MTFLSKKSAFALSALAISMMSTEAHALAIQGLSANTTGANTTQLRIAFDGTPTSPTAYQQANGRQLTLDFNQVSNGGLPRSMPINRGVVNDVTALNSGDLTRLVVNLNENSTYTSRIEGNMLLIDVTPQNGATPAARTAVANGNMTVVVNPLLAPTTGSLSTNYDGISSVNYSGSASGGNITISLANESIPVDVQRQGNKIVIRTPGTTIPRHLLKRINGSGLVANIDANNQGSSGIITINTTGDFEYQAYQSGTSLNINLLPPKMLREPTLEEKVYTGEPLSMEFQDVAVRTVLDVLGQFTETNIVAADNVTGNITLRLINVPWDQALDIILKSRGLGMRKNGNVTLVAPANELAAQEIKELEDSQKVTDLAPLRTEYIRLNYAKAADVYKLLNETTNPGRSNTNGNSDASLLSPRGSLTVDARTNTLIMKDTAESIQNLRNMLEKIDIPVKQVMIEARIVRATDGFSKSLGVRWGFDHNGNDGVIRGMHGFNASTTGTASTGRYSVDLGLASATSGISLGLLNIADSILALELSAMQADNRGEVISSPKVLTTDKQRAKVSSGTQIPYQVSSASLATTVEFKEAALSLEVTPNITPDGKIGLDLDVRNASPDYGNRASTGEVPINEDSVQTNVLLEDGQTVVLGGVFRHTLSNNENKVPFLGDLPGVGRLFKSTERTNSKDELLIFVTPRIVNDGISRID